MTSLTTPLDPFPDLVVAVMDLLVANFPNELGADAMTGQQAVYDHLPSEDFSSYGDWFVRVGHLGGRGDRLTSRGTVDIDVFGRGRTATWDFAQRIHQTVIRYPHRIESSARIVVLDEVTVSTEPQAVPWPDPRVRRFMMSYGLSARRQRRA